MKTTFKLFLAIVGLGAIVIVACEKSEISMNQEVSIDESLFKAPGEVPSPRERTFIFGTKSMKKSKLIGIKSIEIDFSNLKQPRIEDTSSYILLHKKHTRNINLQTKFDDFFSVLGLVFFSFLDSAFSLLRFRYITLKCRFHFLVCFRTSSHFESSIKNG